MISTTISRVNVGKHLGAMLNDDGVFLVLPPDRLSPYSRRLRPLVTQSLTKFTRPPARPVAPVLDLLDEFSALGTHGACRARFRAHAAIHGC